ncbi:MAG: hypothetical protein GX608_09540, partial [Lentisphaerae bacterium]|nr:hypothetical protein [Lentisphaerota bacterium]
DEDGRAILPRRFARQGKIDSRQVALRCIRTARNWFGIPLLTRSSKIQGLQYDPATGYATDVDFSIATTKGTPIYHIPELLIANRYHSSNATRTLAVLAQRHMLVVADKHGIRLSRVERWRMTLNHLVTLAGKHVFFLFLGFRRMWKHWLCLWPKCRPTGPKREERPGRTG